MFTAPDRLHGRILRVLLSVLPATAIAAAGVPAVAQAAASATISGTLVDQASGLPVVNAKIELFQAGRHVAESTSDANGSYSFQNLNPGVYDAEIHASGYEATRSDEVYTFDGSQAQLRTALLRSSQSGGLKEIGTVRTARGGLQTSSVITERVATTKIVSQGMLRIGDALLTLPGITANDLDSAPGDDLHINIRGMKGSETGTLLDGHPIGPIGVGADQRGGYNYQLSPTWGLANTEVTYGSGGLALYGVNVTGGTVNFETLEPTSVPSATFLTGIGTQGRATSIFTTSGTAGHFQYAGSYGVQGSQGGFKPQTFTQTALLVGNPSGTDYFGDLSPGNVAANTWPVSGDYLLRSGVAKLRYALSPATNVTFTAFNATSWDDKTGEGDNDAWSGPFTGYFFDQNAGSQPGCSGLWVKVSDAGAEQCYNRQQFTNAFSGPFGGTPVAWQALRNQDYSLRLVSTSNHNQFTANVFTDTFNLLYNRNDSGHTNNYGTFGIQLANDVITPQNDLTFGVYAYNQSEIDGQFTVGPSSVSFNPTIDSSYNSVFVRDAWTPSGKLSLFASGWLNQNDVTSSSEFEPRLTAMYRPDRHDVLRVSAGKAQGVPQVGLLRSAPQFNLTPGNINPNCSPNGLTQVATTSNNKLQAEKAEDLEVSYGHSFKDDSNIQAIAYDMNQRNVIFSGLVPLTAIGLTPPSSLLAGYLARIGSCNPSATIANLAASQVQNAGTGRFRGINLTGRQRLTRNVFVDYGYYVQSARMFNIPTLAQQNNWTLVDGGQVDKIPVHTANLGIDVSTSHGLDLRLDGFYVGANNGLLRPAYTYANGSITQRVKNLSFNLGVYNMFNSQYDQFGRIGLATFQPENSFGTDANALSQAFNGFDGERFGLPQRSFFFSISQRI